MTLLAENLIPLVNLRPPTTRYRKGVKPPNERMLKRGKQNKKLGDKITIKMWKGMTMYSLTLEERATCPTDCEQWDNCYGDNMPFAHRFDHTDPDFIATLGQQLYLLNEKHTEGFVVRLHVLGDFYSSEYITAWDTWLDKFSNLNIFGYTHHRLSSELGADVDKLNQKHADRFRIRFSDDTTTDFSAHVTDTKAVLPTKGIMCPEQLGLTDSCATCGYCWSSKQPVVFIEH